MTPDEARRELNGLRDLAGGITPQERGRRFEVWLRNLFNASGLDAIGSYRPRGEEIDGSFVLDGRVFLYEAKWTADSLPASSIYAFKGKVDGKLAGTIGTYISMAGFTEDTIYALEKGKDLNVVLIDDEDVSIAIELGVESVLRTKLRAAAEHGTVHFPVRADLVTSLEEKLLPVASVTLGARRIGAVVEGRVARAIVARLAQRVLREHGSPGDFGVDVVASSGFAALPGTAAAILDAVPETLDTLIIADGDYEDEAEQKLALAGDERIRGRGIRVIIAQPTVATAWLGAEPPADRAGQNRYLEAADRIDIAELRKDQSSFDEFARAVEEAAGCKSP
jgi:Restriction endonuclease